MSTETMRKAWANARCKPDQMVPVRLYGGLTIRVQRVTVEAWNALSGILETHGYKADPHDPGGPGAYNCRPITGGKGYSLHAYGIAADINPSRNPYGRDLVTDMPRKMVDEIEALRTNSGKQVFRWGGDWDGDNIEDDRTFDAMHFEIACTPADIASGIAGSVQPKRVDVTAAMRPLQLGSKGRDVHTVQDVVGAKVDGGFGPATEKAVKAFQKSHGLTSDGQVGPKTWAAVLGEL